MQKKIMKIMLITMLLTMTSYMHTTHAATKEIEETNETKPIIVNAKQPRFTIRLESNPTTGYRWFVKSYPSNFVVPVKHIVEKPASDLTGAPTHEVFTFRVKPAAFTIPQELSIRFIYTRPFEQSHNNQSKSFRVMTAG